MTGLDAIRRVAAIAAAALVAVACGGGPAPLDQRPAEVARLEGVVPIVEELRVTDFENSARCRNLAYVRGAFGDLEEAGCEREDTVPFDAPAQADHAIRNPTKEQHNNIALFFDLGGLVVVEVAECSVGGDGVLDVPSQWPQRLDDRGWADRLSAGEQPS